MYPNNAWLIGNYVAWLIDHYRDVKDGNSEENISDQYSSKRFEKPIIFMGEHYNLRPDRNKEATANSVTFVVYVYDDTCQKWYKWYYDAGWGAG